jgi:hypothetical protein
VRLGFWVADRWRRARAGQVPARLLVSAVRTDRRLTLGYLAGFLAAAAGLVAVFAARRPDAILIPLGVLVVLARPLSRRAETVAGSLNRPAAEESLAGIGGALADLGTAQDRDAAIEVVTGTIRGARGVAVIPRDGLTAVVASYPVRREVWVAIDAYEFPSIPPAQAPRLVAAALRGGYAVLPGMLARRARPVWLVLTDGDGHRWVGRRRRVPAPALWETRALAGASAGRS